jgi:hypothetical protein
MSKNELYTQYGIMPVKLGRNVNGEKYYDVGYNRLSVPLQNAYANLDPLICDLKISKKWSF